MYCFLTSLEGILLGFSILTGFIALKQWGKIDRLKDEAKGDRPRHPQDRYREKRKVATRLDTLAPQSEQQAEISPQLNPLDWIPGQVKTTPTKPVEKADLS